MKTFGDFFFLLFFHEMATWEPGHSDLKHLFRNISFAHSSHQFNTLDIEIIAPITSWKIKTRTIVLLIYKQYPLLIDPEIWFCAHMVAKSDDLDLLLPCPTKNIPLHHKHRLLTWNEKIKIQDLIAYINYDTHKPLVLLMLTTITWTTHQPVETEFYD